MAPREPIHHWGGIWPPVTCPLGHGRVSKGGIIITLKPKNHILGPLDVSET